MREILFRGKRTDNGEWVEGYYIHRPTAVCIGESNPSCIWVPAVDPDDNTKIFEVFPETIGQYTGLTDKNGRKIFEGDIVKWTGSLYKVVFEQRFGTAYFGIKISDFETWYFCNSCAANLMEIAGNIYDNPELLKGGGGNG